jgi:ankyrin repeat protein
MVRYPFHRAVGLGAGLDVLKEMHSVSPHAIRELGAFSNTPLHAACAYQAPLDVIAFLLREHPEAAAIQNKHGYFPLHNACEYRVSAPKVILRLIQANPQALGQRNKLGRTPYTTVQRKGDTADPEVLRILYEHTKEVAGTEDPESSSMNFETGG